MQVKISQSWSNRMSACLAAYNTTHTHTKLLFTRISRRQSCVVHITEVKANTIHYVSQLFTNCATWCIHTQRRNPFLRPSPFIIIISNSVELYTLSVFIMKSFLSEIKGIVTTFRKLVSGYDSIIV